MEYCFLSERQLPWDRSDHPHEACQHRDGSCDISEMLKTFQAWRWFDRFL